MKSSKKIPMSKRKQLGFSLIELMASLAIGAILLLVVGSLYITASRQDRTRAVQDDLQATARLIFQRIVTDIDQSGYVDIFDSVEGNKFSKNVIDIEKEDVLRIYSRAVNASGTSENAPIAQLSHGNTFPVWGCDGKISGKPQFAVMPSCEDGLNGRESIQIAYQAVANSDGASLRTAVEENLARTGIAGRYGALDCVGAAIEASAQGFVVNRYFVKSNRNKYVGQFQCIGNGKDAKSTPIADNVRELTFLYGITSESSGNTFIHESESGLKVIQYVPASGVKNWNNVVAVRVCVVLGSGKRNSGSIDKGIVAAQNIIPSCVMPDSGYVRSQDDTNFYQRFSYDINLPNALYFSPVSIK